MENNTLAAFGKGRIGDISQRAGIFLIAWLLFFLPFSGTKTIQGVLFFLLVIVFIVKTKLSDKENARAYLLQNKPLSILIALSFLWGVVTLGAALDPLYSFREFAGKLGAQYILYFIALTTISDVSTSSDSDRIKRIFLPFLFAVAIMSLYACYEFYRAPYIFESRVSSLTGGIFRLAVFLVLSIPLVAALNVVVQGWLKWALSFILLVATAALFFTFTRSAWIAFIIEVSIFVAIIFRRWRMPLLVGIVSFSLVFIALSHKSVIPKQLIDHGIGSSQDRIAALKLSMEIISQHPFAGIGYGKKAFSMYYPNVKEVVHAHNIFLSTAVETGIIGLLIFIVMLIVVLKDFVTAIKRECLYTRKIILLGIFTSLIGFLILNLFDYQYPGWPGKMLWILIGAGYALMNSVPERKSVHSEAKA